MQKQEEQNTIEIFKEDDDEMYQLFREINDGQGFENDELYQLFEAEEIDFEGHFFVGICVGIRPDLAADMIKDSFERFNLLRFSIYNQIAQKLRGKAFVPQYLSFEDSKESLKDGKIDAAFIVAGAPTTAITELATTNGVYMINIDGAIRDSILSDCPYYTSYQIPAGTYPGQDEPVETITVKATIVVSESLDEDTVYDMTAAIFDHADEISAENAKGAELSLENATSGMTIPFHKGAARYYAEHGITVDTKGE